LGLNITTLVPIIKIEYRTSKHEIELQHKEAMDIVGKNEDPKTKGSIIRA
jgi:hypothetical protein